MDNLETLVSTFQELLAEIQDTLNDATVSESVEVGSTLFHLLKEAEAIQDQIKVKLREAALEDLSHGSGVAKFEGTCDGSVTITVPKAKPRLRKDADIDLLRKALGEDFDLYLETVTNHNIRTITPDLISQMEDGQPKTILLSSIEEVEGTPRVSFQKK